MVVKQILARAAALTAAAGLMLTLSLSCAAEAAPAASTPKEENIYVRLYGSGAPESVYVVNMFSLEQPGLIQDYGSYTALRNLTSEAEITAEGDSLTVPAEEGPFYYQGDLPDAVLPWCVALHYTLDGKPIAADALGGQNGHLVISGDVIRNPAAEGGFFEAYMLQVVLSLDTVTCRNIRAEGATMANVGSLKQMTYMKLPGQELHFTVEADVVDFAMSGISLNGVPFSLHIEPDTSAISAQLAELSDGTAQLDTGANELLSGTAQLRSGLTEAQGGTDELRAGADTLQSGLSLLAKNNAALNDGARQITDALLATANQKLRSYGIICTDMTWDTYASVLEELLDTNCLRPLLIRLSRGTLEQLRTQLDAVCLFRTSLQQYTDGVAAAAAGASALKQGTAQLSGGVLKLKNGADALYSGTVKLTNGTGLLRSSTADLDTRLADAVTSLIDSMTGSGWEPHSFVSPKNTSVSAVQFVMTTPAIEKPVAPLPPEETAPAMPWWERLLTMLLELFSARPNK